MRKCPCRRVPPCALPRGGGSSGMDSRRVGPTLRTLFHQDPDSMSDVRDVIIIGSGPAGYTAAIYSARANLRPLLFQGMQPGGQLTITTDVENYPGYPEGVMGPKMMEDFQAQAARFGTDIRFEQIVEVDLSKRPFTIKSDFDTLQAKSLIVATGATAKLLGLENESRLMGHG